MVQIVEVTKELISIIDRFEKSKSKKDQIIQDYLEKIQECIQDIVKELESHEAPTWLGLKKHLNGLSENIGDVIGKEEANNISKKLSDVLEKPPDRTDTMLLGELKELIVSIKASAAQIPLPKQSKSPPAGSIKRRDLFASALWGGASVVAVEAAALLVSQRIVKWKMVSVFGEDTKKLILPNVPQIICKRIGEMTDGLFTIEIDKSKEFNTDEILRRVSDGEIQCGYSGIFYGKDEYKALFFGCAIPFGLSPQEQTAWLLYKKDPDDELTFMQGIYKKLNLNVIPFPVGGTGRQMGGWFKKEIKSVSDFKDLTMRIPGLGAKVLELFGVQSDKNLFGEIPIDKLAEALREGRIDAAEWNGPHDDMALDLHNAARYYYYPGWWETSSTLDIQVNFDDWNKLSDKYKAIFKAVCQETYTETVAEYDRKNSEKLERIYELGNSGSLKVLRFNDEILQEAKKQTEYLLNKYSSKDKTFREVYKEWKQFKKRIQRWSNLNEL